MTVDKDRKGDDKKMTFTAKKFMFFTGSSFPFKTLSNVMLYMTLYIKIISLNLWTFLKKATLLLLWVFFLLEHVTLWLDCSQSTLCTALISTSVTTSMWC